MAHLVTGHAGIEHIKPSDDGAFNIGIFGNGQYVFPIGEQFGYEIISNNLIKIKSGELVNQGRHINIPVNNYEEVIIENGLQDVKRHDIIVMRYERNPDTSIESASVVVLKGTSSANPSDPSMALGNIYEGANVSDMPLYRVRLDGLNIEGVDCLFDTIPSIEAIKNSLSDTKYTRLEGTNCVVFYNDFEVVIHINAPNLNLTGGNITPTNNKVATLPSNITVNFIQFTNSVDVMDSSWVPTGNTMVMMIQNGSIFGRCRSNATNGVIAHTVTIPRYLVSIT